jgi:hypothetical protein
VSGGTPPPQGVHDFDASDDCAAIYAPCEKGADEGPLSGHTPQ